MDWCDDRNQLASATAEGRDGNPAPFNELVVVSISATPPHSVQLINPRWNQRQRYMHWLAWRVRMWAERLACWLESRQ